MDIKQQVREMRSLLPANFVHEQIKIIEGSSINHKKADKVVKWLSKYGFEEIRLGTNILTMKHKNYKDVVYKIALDDEGQKDGIRDKWYSTMIPEYVEVYYVAPQGVYSIQQKVRNFRDRDHFMEYIEEVLRIQKSLIEDYDMLLVDMSLKTFLNYGLDHKDRVRILDGSDMIQLEGLELRCQKKVMKKRPEKGERPFKDCGGKLDYDEDYHYLVCQKCGHEVLPIEIAKTTMEEVKLRKMKLSHGLPMGILKAIEDLYGDERSEETSDRNVQPHDTLIEENPVSPRIDDDDEDDNDLIKPFDDSLDDDDEDDEYAESGDDDDDDRDEEPPYESPDISAMNFEFRDNDVESQNVETLGIRTFSDQHTEFEVGQKVTYGTKLNHEPVNGYNIYFYIHEDGGHPVFAVVPADSRFRSPAKFDSEVLAALEKTLASVTMIYVQELDDDGCIEEYLELQQK